MPDRQHILTTVLVAALACPVPAAAAPDGIHVEAEQGKWVAFSHTSDGLHTDGCMAGLGDVALVFTAASNGIEIRTSDPGWNLPADAQGDVRFDTDTTYAVYHMVAADEHTLAAIVRPSEVRLLLDGLATTSAATITYGRRTSRRSPCAAARPSSRPFAPAPRATVSRASAAPRQRP